jgi:hypothetical protein
VAFIRIPHPHEMLRHEDPDLCLFYRCCKPTFYYRCEHVTSDEIRHRMCWRCRQTYQRVHGAAGTIERRIWRVQVENQGQGWNMESEMAQGGEDIEGRRWVVEERDKEAEKRE